MKSLFLLCEKGIQVNLVEELIKKNISFDDILINNDIIDNIFGNGIKKKLILDAANNIKYINRDYSVYDLVPFGLSKTIADKMFELNINVLEIDRNLLDKKKISEATSNKILLANRLWRKSNGVPVHIELAELKKILENNFKDKKINFRDICKIIDEEGYDSIEVKNMLLNLGTFLTDDEFQLSYSIDDLLKYGLSKVNYIVLKDKGITLSDIDYDLREIYNISQHKFNQILIAYNKFAKDTNYIPPLNENRLLKLLLNEFKYECYSKEDVYELLESEIDKKNIDDLLVNLVKNKLIIFKNNLYYNVFPTLFDKLEEISNKNNHYDIVYKKLSGKTLEEIGQEYGLTRERIRQIYSKEINKISTTIEDKYEKYFIKYNFDEDTFCGLFNETKQVYYYLKEKYIKGNTEIYEIFNDNDFTSDQLDFLRKKYNVINYNDENIVVTKQSLLIAILKASNKQLDYETLINEYNKIITENEFEIDKLMIDDYRNIDAILNRNRFVLNTLGSSYRYYNCDDVDSNDIKELKKLFDIESGVYSSELFFNDNPLLMKKIDIRDEYELHNLFRKVLGNFSKKVEYSRMPDIYIDCDDKLTFIEEKIEELSPISLDDFVEYIYQNYGHKVNTMKAYVLGNLNKYLSTENDINYLVTDCPLFNDEQYNYMKKYLKEDIYSNITIKQLLTDEFNVNDFKLLNNINFSRLGYKVRGNYIMKLEINNLETYFRNKVLSEDFYVIPAELKKIGSTYSSYLYKLVYDKLIFKIEDDKYITMTKLNKMGINIDDINDFINKVEKNISDDEYFNLYKLNTNFSNKLFEYDFPDCFYENIIMIIQNVKTFSLKNNMLFIKTQETATREKFINSFIVKNKTYISEIKDLIKQQYNIELQESYIKDFINKNKYYLQSNTNCVYLSKKMYEDEINQWDILKYIN